MSASKSILAAALLAVSCILSSSSAQYLETTIYLPDSLCGVVEPNHAVYNSVNDKLYVNGNYGNPWIVVIDCSTNRRMRKINLAQYPGEMCYNPRNNKVYCAGRLGQGVGVYVIDGSTDSVRSVAPVPASVNSMCYSPDQNKVYCLAEYDSAVTVLDGEADTAVARVEVGYYPSEVVWCPSADKVYCSITGGIAVIDCVTDSVVARIALPPRYTHRAMCTDSSGSRLYVSTVGDSLAIIDTGADTLIRYLVGGAGKGLCLNPVNNKVYWSQFGDPNILVIDCRVDSVVASIRGPTAHQMCYASADNVVYATASGSSCIAAIDGTTNRITAMIPVRVMPTGFCYSSLSNHVYGINSTSSNITVVAGDSVQTTIAVGSVTGSFCYNPAGDKLYCANHFWPEMYVVDCAANTPVATISLPGIAYNVCYSAASNTVYCAGEDSLMYVVDCGSDTVIVVFNIGWDWSESRLCDNPAEGKMYALRSWYQNEVKVIDAFADRDFRSIPVGRYAKSLLLNPTRNVIYCGCIRDSTIWVIDARRDSVVGVMRYTEFGGPSAVCYNTYRDRLYAASGDLVVYDGLADTAVAWLRPGGHCYGVATAPKVDKYYFADGYFSRLISVDAAADTILKIIPLVGGDWGCYLSVDTANNKAYYAAQSGPGIVYVIDCKVDTVTMEIEVGGRPSGLIWCARHGRTFCKSDWAGCLRVIRDSVYPGIQHGEPSNPRRGPTATLHRYGVRISAGEPVSLFDAGGRLVGVLPAGRSDYLPLRAGVYFLHEPGRSSTRKLVIVE